jgi:hypothetical protein
MKDLFDKQPLSNEAPQGLRNKVEFAARQKPGRQWFGTRTRWAVAGTAVAAAAIGVVMFMTPASAEAKTWDMVTAAYEQVRGVLIQMEFTGQGDQGSLTIAGKGNDWRMTMDGLADGKDERVDVSYSGGELTIWDGGDTALVMSLGFNIPFSPEDVMKGMTEQLSASKIFKEHADEIGRDNIRIEQPEWVGNRHVYNVYINEKDGNGQVHILIDADTDLPVSMDISGPNGEEMRMSFQFDGDFDSSLLRPIIPSGVKIERTDMSKMMGGGGVNHEDMLKGLEEFGKSFEGGRGMFDDHHEDRVEIKDKTVRIETAVKNG